MIKIFLISMLSVSSMALAAAKKIKEPTDSLVQENQSLSVSVEDTVQVAKPESRRTMELFFGYENSGSITFYQSGSTTRYPLDGWTSFNMQYGYYPIRYRAMFGLIGGVGYSYLEQRAKDVATSLHLIPMDLMLASRYAFSSRFEALFSVGGGTMIAIQRGDEIDNGSKAKGYGVWQTGVSYGPNVQSDMPWEILLMYGQRFGPTTEAQNWNGSFVRLGVGVRLD